MLTKCVICGFNVRKDDRYCLNCGKKNPTKEFYEDGKFKAFLYKIIESNTSRLILSFLLIFIVVFVLSEIATTKFPKYVAYVWLSAIIFWIFLSVFLFLYIEVWNFPKPAPKIIRNKNNLISKSKTIENRMIELSRRGQQIDSVLSKIGNDESENLQEVRRKLLTAREIVMSQFARYELQKQKIELVRLQNGVSPYLFKLHRLNEFQTEDGLVTIENTRHEINKIRTILTRFDAIEFPRNTLPEKENFLAQLSETENSCQNLREALLSKQATRALQGISPIAEKLKIPHTNELAHTAETFNLQTTLTDFSESFEELEREYRRVQSESEISQKILTDET